MVQYHLLIKPVSEATEYLVMSKATKRKHVTKEVLEELVEPEGDQFIVKVRSKKINFYT